MGRLPLLVILVGSVVGLSSGEWVAGTRVSNDELGMVQITPDIDVLFVPDDCPQKSKGGDQISIHYKGIFEKDGSEFDSSHTSGNPFEFVLGRGQVIKGWDRGLKDMCVGEKRKLRVPPELGYGRNGIENVPGGATLIFEVELVSITEPPNDSHSVDMFGDADTNKDKKLTREELRGFMERKAREAGADKVSPEELEKAMQMYYTVVDQMISSDDKNKDGVVSWDEFSGPKHDEL